MDFVAIDFETANQQPSSACQLAAVVVRESKIVFEKSWLIRPPSDYFSPVHISIHGIRLTDVLGSPTMERVWPELAQILEGNQLPLIAHNARFDMSVLLASLAVFDIACPDLQFNCTRVLARAAWPGRQGYGLKPLGQWLGIQFRHHDALEDARCCAKISLAIEEQTCAMGTLEELERKLAVSRGHLRQGRLVSPKSQGRRTNQSARRSYSAHNGFPVNSPTRPIGSVCTETIRRSCLGQPLAGKNIVMLGPMRGLTLDQTHQLLSELGATVQSEIDSTTHLVVACGTTTSQAKLLATSPAPASQQRANRPIRVLSERQFRALLPGGAVSLD